MIESLHYLQDPIHYGIYGIFLTMGIMAGFISSTVHPEYKKPWCMNPPVFKKYQNRG